MENNQQLVKQDEQAVIPASPSHLLELAISKDLDVEKLRELMQLQKEWQADRAREAFFQALTEFQAVVPELRKSKKVSFRSEKTGHLTEYHYATLGDITRQIRPALKEVSIAYRWEIKDTPEEITVTCLISHGTHTERTTMMAKPDLTGSKNPIQARGSTIEYLKRYTLIGALGLSTADADVDGAQPPVDIDKLHKEFMELYNQLIQIDGGYSKFHPDNWKGERTAKNYIRAIGELRKKLVEHKGAAE